MGKSNCANDDYCVICLVKTEKQFEHDQEEENSRFLTNKKKNIGSSSGNDNDGALLTRFLALADDRFQLGKLLDFGARNKLKGVTSTSSFCGHCSEVVSNLCDLHDELRQVEKSLFRKVEEVEVLLKTESTVQDQETGKTAEDELDHLRKMLSRQIRWYLDENGERGPIKNDISEHEDSQEDNRDGDGSEYKPDSEDDASYSMDDDDDDEEEEEMDLEMESDVNEDPLAMDIAVNVEDEICQIQTEQPSSSLSSKVTTRSQGKRNQRRKPTAVSSQASDDDDDDEVTETEVPTPKRQKLQKETMNLAKCDWSPRPCDICKGKTVFATAKNLRQHMVSHHEKRISKKSREKPRFQCHLCHKVYHLAGTLKVHLELSDRVHSSRYYSDLRLRCDGETGENECSEESYGTFADLEIHLKTRHPGAKVHRCSTCDWPFLNESARDLHQLNHICMSASRRYRCPKPDCPTSFSSLQFYKVVLHFSSEHGTDLKPFGCEKCPVRSYTMSMHQKHVELDHKLQTVNNEPLDFRCKVCSDKSFSTLRQLQWHQRACKIYQCQCDICGEKMEWKELAKHKGEIHQVGKPPRPNRRRKAKRSELDVDNKTSDVPAPRDPGTSGENSKTSVNTGQDPSPKTSIKRGPVVSKQKKDWSFRPCGICNARFQVAGELGQHMGCHERAKMKELGENAKPGFQCPLCSKAYYVEDTLKVHLEIGTLFHNNRYFSDGRFRCDGENGENECSTETYETFAELSSHLETHHPTSTVHYCGTCKWPFLNENARDLHQLLHIRTTPDSERLFLCPTCKFSGTALAPLLRHFSIEHAKDLRPFRCPQCPTRHYSLHMVEKHIKMQHKVATLNNEPVAFLCEICSETSYETLMKLQRHQRRCRARVCDICGEKQSDLTVLVKHKLEVHQVETVKDKICPYCGQTFLNEVNLRMHRKRRHAKEITGKDRERNHICQDCGKAFCTFTDLRLHRNRRHPQ